MIPKYEHSEESSDDTFSNHSKLSMSRDISIEPSKVNF